MKALQAPHADQWWQRSRPSGRTPRASLALSPASSAGLGRLFDSTWEQPTPATSNKLRKACVGFVQRLRADGQTPEKVLVAMKREITGSGALHQAPSLCIAQMDETEARRARAYEQLFGWFLDAYFDS